MNTEAINHPLKLTLVYDVVTVLLDLTDVEYSTPNFNLAKSSFIAICSVVLLWFF